MKFYCSKPRVGGGGRERRWVRKVMAGGCIDGSGRSCVCEVEGRGGGMIKK